MSKRKQDHDMDVDGDSDDDDTPTIVDVNFDFYNVNTNNDYHSINRLLVQLFGPDAESLQTGPLTDVISKAAEESGVGSTIKTDEEEGSDSYAILTVVSCHNNPGVKLVLDYVLSKTSADQQFHDTLSSLLQNRPQSHVGLVFSERVINMPVQVMAPMYRMFSEEIDDAIKDGDPYQFTHYLFVSRVYRLTPEEEEAMVAAQRNSKRHKSASSSQIGRNKEGVYGFHPEDDEIIQHATHVLTYSFTNAQPRDQESIGLDIAGRVMLVPAEKFKDLVKKIDETYAVAESNTAKSS